MTLRPATLADASRLAELSGALGYPADVKAMAARLERLLPRPDHVVLVAEDEAGHIVGWVHGAEVEMLESGPKGEVLGLVVDAKARGLGAGRRLVDAVEVWAAARGLGEVVVRSNVARAESHPFYARIGYARVKTQHVYRKPLPPALSHPTDAS